MTRGVGERPLPSRAPACQRVPLPHYIDRSHSEGRPIGHGSQVALDQLQHEDKPLYRWLAWVLTLYPIRAHSSDEGVFGGIASCLSST